jgi:RNA chaperone Hfq
VIRRIIAVNVGEEESEMPQTRTSPGQNFQDNVLAQLRDRRAPATLYLNNRMALHGRILDFDPYVLLLQPNDGGPIQMIYKSALVSVAGPPRGPRRGDRGPRPERADRPPRGDRPERPDRPGSRYGDRPERRWEDRPPTYRVPERSAVPQAEAPPPPSAIPAEPRDETA